MSDVKIMDAGEKLLFSGSNADAVQAELTYFVGRGSKIISPVSQVGSTWVAACTPPAESHSADRTSTLNLAEILKAQQNLAPVSKEEPQSDNVCTIEKVGFKRLVTGPTQAAVQAITERFLDIGAGIVSGPEEVFGQWSAVCDVGDSREKGG
jgi:hypothetical protein